MSRGLAITAGALARPGRYLDGYPESRVVEGDFFERLLAELACSRRGRALSFRRFRKLAARIETVMRESAELEPPASMAALGEVRGALKQRGVERETLIRAFALVGVEVKRLFGFDLHREQLYCAWVLLHGGLAEMATGEGKSITAALAAIVAALGGAPVHVITTNDYLVERDAVSMRELFDRFDLTSGFAIASQNDDARRDAYAKDICYVSNKQVVFDYLRDRQLLGNRPSSLSARIQGLLKVEPSAPLLRGLCFAIVDEADSVLIDDAITPLILSQQTEGGHDVAQALTAISLARRLVDGEDFTVDGRARRVIISESGEYRLATLASGLEGVWKNRRFRLELARQALSAIHLFQRDKDYLVRDGAVVLIDQSTGRVMPDRKLQHGLHQMVETKEKCELSGKAETLSSLSFQTFFRRYKFLCGMTGTAREAAAELRRVYGLAVVPVPTHRPSARIGLPPRFAIDGQAHARLLIREIRQAHAAGRPILVGTRSLAESERISSYLEAEQLPHQLLNARQDEREAEVVAAAGRAGAITIATNMAGRGTDIPLDGKAKQAGGLQVIVAELNDNLRVDRQLIGRGARQGDPGSYVYLISLTDEMLQRYAPKPLLRMLGSGFVSGLPLWHRLCLLLGRRVQIKHERQQRRMRRQVSSADEEMNRRLSFSGYKE